MNKPVAWMHQDDRDTFFSAIDHSESNKWIPLYTHPVKELTDEEILKEIRNAISCYFDDTYSYSDELYYKIEAILRKAQE